MPRGNPGHPLTIRFDADVLRKVRELLRDPVRGKTRYASLSDLMNQLLLQWTADQIKQINEAKKAKGPTNE